MSRRLAVVQPLPPGDHAVAFRDDPPVWLPVTRAIGPGRWRLELWAGPVRRAVACHVGDPWTTPTSVQRHVRWDPLPDDADIVPLDRWLPSFDGTLYLTGGRTVPSLALQGDVAVPLGRVGEAVDAVALGRVGHRTVARLLGEVAGLLTVAALDPQSVVSGAHQRS